MLGSIYLCNTKIRAKSNFCATKIRIAIVKLVLTYSRVSDKRVRGSLALKISLFDTLFMNLFNSVSNKRLGNLKNPHENQLL